MDTTRRDRQDTIPVRLPRTLVEQLRPIAVAHDRSLAAELRVALTAYVREQTPTPIVTREQIERTRAELADEKEGE